MHADFTLSAVFCAHELVKYFDQALDHEMVKSLEDFYDILPIRRFDSAPRAPYIASSEPLRSGDL